MVNAITISVRTYVMSVGNEILSASKDRTYLHMDIVAGCTDVTLVCTKTISVLKVVTFCDTKIVSVCTERVSIVTNITSVYPDVISVSPDVTSVSTNVTSVCTDAVSVCQDVISVCTDVTSVHTDILILSLDVFEVIAKITTECA